jgi:hypothetical protein
MSIDVKVVRLRDLLALGHQGALGLSSVIEDVQQIALVRGAFSTFDVLVDTRGTESALSATDTWEVAAALASAVHAGEPRGFSAKIAVLCPADHFGNAKFFELCALNRGLNVRAFTAFEEVFDWLATSSPLTGSES